MIRPKEFAVKVEQIEGKSNTKEIQKFYEKYFSGAKGVNSLAWSAGVSYVYTIKDDIIECHYDHMKTLPKYTLDEITEIFERTNEPGYEIY